MPSNEQMLNKESKLATIKKNIDVPMAVSDAEAFLVDTINSASTLPTLQPIFRDTPAGNLDVLSVGRRKLRQAGRNDTPDITTDAIANRQIPYAVKKVKWDEWLQNDDVYYSLSARNDNVEQKVISMIQSQLAVDLQDLAFNGDASSTDSFIQILDGFVKKSLPSPNKTELADKDLAILDFVNHIQVLPEKYKTHTDVTWFINQRTHDRLVSLVSERQTGYGDAVLVDGRITRLAGYNVRVVSELQQGFAALTPASNYKPVFTRNLRYIRTADGATAAAKDATYHVLYSYLDCVVREVPAVAYMTGDNL
ncbi:phage major capsid protein [Geomicrobium sp. JCM 19039]|uniref:phage major capsid protein n=1 Tax=Geomicrobium sp. JCM 19039 TaxID=1460636 RepID=UPI00045F3E4C|nr:phage major capsid protein [Geomicrobium sp. JCM 19039]GAK11391.1 phage capsid and scaffold [Geomicrobium sp. JCM 19039]